MDSKTINISPNVEELTARVAATSITGQGTNIIGVASSSNNAPKVQLPKMGGAMKKAQEMEVDTPDAEPSETAGT